MKILTEKNTKILKGRDKGYMIFGIHMLPGKLCARASVGCLKACLNTSGHGRYRNTQEARARKTKFFFEQPKEFINQLHDEIVKAVARAKCKNLEAAFRLNLTSDIPWECYGVPQAHKDIIFYDYTKYYERRPPDNYFLTMSRSESLQNHLKAKEWLKRGGNVAVVFKGPMPKTYWGAKVFSGEDDDLRFLDPRPAIIGLKAKGKAIYDSTGFVVKC